MKIMMLNTTITVVMENGNILSKNDCTKELHEQVVAINDNTELSVDESEIEVKKLLFPELYIVEEKVKEVEAEVDNFYQSKLLTVYGESIYLESVSQLTLPGDLARAILKAELEDDQELIETYTNFWTLACMNPDSRARTNLFWFLNRYGMTISKTGLFIAYRNVLVAKEGSAFDATMSEFVSERYAKTRYIWKKSAKNYHVGYNKDGDPICNIKKENVHTYLGPLDECYKKLSNENVATVYTDKHTQKMEIMIGKPVSIDRSECDPIQTNTCSRGLHVAGRSWLTQGYFGDVPLAVLVNPADVVAVPPRDGYGKMRVCAYYPFQVVEMDNRKIVEKPFKDGFEDDFMKMICHTGEINEEQSFDYTLEIPTIPELDRSKIIRRFDEIKQSLNKVE